MQYDDLNRVTICEQTGYYDEPFARSNYNDYDLVNNLMSISRHEDGDTGEIFSYDDANQLSSVSYKAEVEWHAPGGAPGGTIEGVEEDGEKETLAALAADPEREPLAKDSVEIEAMSGPRTVTYTNDAINRLSMNDPNDGIPTNYARNHLNQYTSVTGHGPLSYDGNLNVSGYDGWAFVHDAEKRLLSVTGNGHSAQFAYDGLGRCVKRTIDGATTLFTYDNWKPVAEWTGAGAFVAWNLYGAGPDEILVRYQQNPEGYLHYHLDAMGNVQFLLSDHSNPGLEKYTYDVFGKPTIIGWNGDVRPISNHGNRFLFTGREYLYTFGLYDYRYRTYHPGLGRFIQTDPLGLQIEGAKLSAQQKALYALGGAAPEKFSSSELNLYRYCHNNPINRFDPFGLLDFRFDKDFPVKGPTGREAIEGEIKKELAKSAKGREILDSDGVVKIHRVNAAHPRTGTDYSPDRRVKNFDTYLDHTDSRFQDKVTFRQLFRHKGELPPDDVRGRAVMLGHELAHGVFKMADEHDGGRNIRDNENAIRRELGLPERRTEGGVLLPRQ